ncbi:MAG TPA: Fe-S cluster assembly protein SufD [Longimicrobium sp.]|nr:Fe-S cluster assembly protein SufD [Longimicrobium sp.]
MTDTTTAAPPAPGVFTRDQVAILAAGKLEPQWLHDRRVAAWQAFAEAPMPSRGQEDWRYSWQRFGKVVDLDAYAFPVDRAPAVSVEALPAGLRAVIEESGETSARLAQVDASVVWRELPEELRAQGVVFTSLEAAVREHPEIVEKYLGTAVTPEIGKFAALNAAFWTGGLFIYVPRNVRVEVPLRAYRWIGDAGTAVFGRTLVVAEAGSQVAVVDELASGDFGRTALHTGAAEIFADEGATVVYTSAQRFGRGVAHLQTDRLVAGRDAKITMLYSTLGADFARVDAQCAMRAPGSHVDVLGIYIGQGDQHFDHETLQDHSAPHASSNLLFKGAIDDEARSVFRGLIRVHPKAQRTDAYQTNRNLVLSAKARADSLPNLEIQADDVRCSHAATVGQLDEEEIFYLLSRGIPKGEAVRLVVFGFFAEVLDQLPLEGVRGELLRAVERKLARRG